MPQQHLNATDQISRSPLHYACHSGQHEAVISLLQGTTLLHTRAEFEEEEELRPLVTLGKAVTRTFRKTFRETPPTSERRIRSSHNTIRLDFSKCFLSLP